MIQVFSEGEEVEVCGKAWEEEDNEWTGGLAHKCSKGRTCLVRQWRKVRVDADAAALMFLYELNALHETAKDRCAENLRVAFGLSVFDLVERWQGEENACSVVHHVCHVITDFIPILIDPLQHHRMADCIEPSIRAGSQHRILSKI